MTAGASKLAPVTCNFQSQARLRGHAVRSRNSDRSIIDLAVPGTFLATPLSVPTRNDLRVILCVSPCIWGLCLCSCKTCLVDARDVLGVTAEGF